MINRMLRQTFCASAVLLPLAAAISPASSFAQESRDSRRHPEAVRKYLERLYGESHRKYTYRDDYPGGFEGWQRDARAKLRRLIGLSTITSQVGGHKPQAQKVPPHGIYEHSGTPAARGMEPEGKVRVRLLRA